MSRICSSLLQITITSRSCYNSLQLLRLDTKFSPELAILVKLCFSHRQVYSVALTLTQMYDATRKSDADDIGQLLARIRTR